jgi:hypothetical protein
LEALAAERVAWRAALVDCELFAGGDDLSTVDRDAGSHRATRDGELAAVDLHRIARGQPMFGLLA